MMLADKHFYRPFITHRCQGPSRKSALTVANTPTALGLALTPAESVNDEEEEVDDAEESLVEKSSRYLGKSSLAVS